jgi:hypothetical protein
VSLSSALASKIFGELDMPLVICGVDSWSRSLDGFDKVLVSEVREDEFVALDVNPGHFLGAYVAGGAGRQLSLSLHNDLPLVSNP